MSSILSTASHIRQRLRERFFLNFVFVHINKAAGSSIENALGIQFAHKTAQELRVELGTRAWRRRFKFAFVRNPWDKVVSHYRYRVETNQTALGTDPIDFETWVRLAYGERDPRYHDKPRMFMPQWDWISDDEGRLIIDFVGRFEHLQRDFAIVADRIGVQATLPHLKSSSRGHYRKFYDRESREIITRCFAKDITAFEYTF